MRRAAYRTGMERGTNYALIGAYDAVAGPGGLRALLPLAGAPLVEHQARRAVAAGASRILLLVDEIPAELVAVVERLRQDGIGTAFCQGIDRVADALEPDGRLLILCDACLPDEHLLGLLIAGAAPAVAVVPDSPANEMFERIDADSRWAGVALVDRAHVSETAVMLGSWDPVSTLLRRAVQRDARRVVTSDPPIIVHDEAALIAAERRMVAATRLRADDWIGRTLFARIEEAVLPQLLARGIGTRTLTFAAIAMACIGVLAAWTGWLWPALVALMMSGPMAAVTRRLARVRDQHDRALAAMDPARDIAAALALLGLASLLQRSGGQWGWWIVAALAIAAVPGRFRTEAEPAWLASADVLVWTMLPAALVGGWPAGLVTIVIYAVGSFVFGQVREIQTGSRIHVPD